MANTETVIGYHGTSRSQAGHILSAGFHPSRNAGDWLGEGVYFWEQAPNRAFTWACGAHAPAEVCVLEAEISLAECLNLADPEGIKLLRPFYQAFVEQFGREAVARLSQTRRTRGFDCAVINWACSQLREEGKRVRVVRAPFIDGVPLWSDSEGVLPASEIFTKGHVQLAVRDVRAIQSVRDYGHQGPPR